MAKALCVDDGYVLSSVCYNYTDEVPKQGITFHKYKVGQSGTR